MMMSANLAWYSIYAESDLDSKLNIAMDAQFIPVREFEVNGLLVPKQGSWFGVGDGVRTRDIRCHRPTLYQLSYAHQRSDEGQFTLNSQGIEEPPILIP